VVDDPGSSPGGGAERTAINFGLLVDCRVGHFDSGRAGPNRARRAIALALGLRRVKCSVLAGLMLILSPV